MKRKSIFKVILTAIVVALTFPVAVLFSACDQNPPAPCEVIFCIDGRKEKTAEVAKNASLSVDEANALYNETRTGYTLDGWYTDSAMTQRFEGVAKVEDKVVLYGTYNKNSYTLRFVLGNGDPDIVSTVEYEAPINAPTDLTREGYDFVGWDKDIPATMPAEDLTISANWQVQSYSILFVFNNGQEDYEDVLDYGAPIVAPDDPTLEGYTFMGWSPEVPAIMPAEDMTFEAGWEINQYTITFDTDGGDQIDPITQNYNTTISAPADPEKTGYTFAGWLPAVPSTMPSQNMTCVAQWTPIDYTIRFMLNNEEDDIVSIMHYGDPIVAPTGFDKIGYTFVGWDPELPATMPNQSVTYGALWTINSYTITFDTVGGTSIDPKTQHYGSSIVAPADPTLEGYTFMGWSPEVPATMPAEDMTCVAQWQIRQFTITFDCNGGSPDIDPITNDYGAAVTPPQNPTKVGYTFAGWNPVIPNVMPAEDRTCVAQWTINKHTVTYDMDGVLANVVEQHEYGEVLTQIANPTHEGYDFSVWDGVLPATMPDYNVVLRAVWTVKQFSITYVLHNGEQDIVDPWDYGEEVVAPADPTRAGYTFDGWDENIPTNMPAENLTINAQWTPNSITITFDSNEGTPVDPITQDCGTPVAGPTADPTKTGHTFAGWYEDNGSFNNAFAFPNTMPTENITLYAKWVAVGQRTITFMVDDVQYTQITDYVGASITLPAEPTKDGYTFGGWNPAVPATMPAENLTVAATWNKIQYSLTLLNFDDSVYYAGNYETNDEIVTPDGPARNYYTFVYWLVCDTSAGFWQSMIGAHLPAGTSTAEIQSTIYGNLVLKAVYNPTQYSITFDEDGGEAVSDLTYTIETATFDLAGTTKTGYVFAGWFDSGDNEHTQVEQGSHGDIALTAHWTLDTYSITYNLDGGTNGANPATYTIETATITLADATKDDYDFAGWYNNSDLAIEHQVTEIAQGSTGNVELWAKWTLHNYAISYDLGEGGVNNPNNPSTFTINSGTIHLQNPTRPGYTFGGWIRGGQAIYNIVCANEHADISVMAVWTIQQYTLTFVFNNGYSDIVVNDIQYGTELNYETYLVDEAHLAPSKRGYTFQTFEDEDENDWSEIETMPGHDLVFTAVYTLNPEMEDFVFESTKDDCVINGIIASKKATITAIYVPEYVTVVADGAFAGCPFIQTLAIPFSGISREATTSETYWAMPFHQSKPSDANAHYTNVKSGYWVPNTLINLIILQKFVANDNSYPFEKDRTTTIQNVYFAGTIEDWCGLNFGTASSDSSGRNPMNPTTTTHFFYMTNTTLDNKNLNNYVELTELTIPTTVRYPSGTPNSLGPWIFEGFSSLTKVIIPVNVKRIAKGAFANCTSLTEIVILETSFNRGDDGIHADAFTGCTALTSVYFAGDETQWTSLSSKIKSNFNGATIYFKYGNTLPTTAGNYWNYNDQQQIVTLLMRSITFESNGGSAVDTIVAEVGTAVVSPTEPTQSGYTFDGWYTDEDVLYTFTTMPADNITLYAKWTAE